MIKFKNINGDVFLAVGSVKRKSALNGEKSLSATITQGDDVLNKIDKGWSLEFDNEPYVVTYFERNDNNNTVEIDAIHKFFWDMTKSVLYNSYSNSHVARFYLDEIFKDTGYTYALNFDPKAFEKENWGMKNKLSLFNDAISSMGAEFEINGTLISIFKNVGSDLSTIVRHGFNLSDMTLENDNANFATYGEGFGAYDDKENQKGPRLHVTYTSPLAKAFGKLHAEPIVDERYTVKDNLLSAVKDKVDSSFAVSVKLSLYDLTAAGYPYKMANVGDWLLAVDEHLDFKQKIRIISVDDEFAEDGTRISYTVTCGDVGVTKKYQDANAALTQKVQSAYENAQIAKDAAIQAVISSTGKNTIYDNIDGEENLPKTANEGDLAFVQTGDGKAMYIYTKMPDGSFKWVKHVDSETGKQIAAGVEEAIATSNKHTDELNEKQASETAAFQSEANVASSSAAAERADMFKQSTSMANSASAHADTVASSASAYAKAQAASALSSANSALSEAKSDLTDGIASEASERQQAVQTVNSQAQSYAEQAKADAMSAASSADGVIRKAISSSADSLSATITQNKSSTDSGISTAQTTAQAAVDGLTLKVSQTDYDKKTGDLSTKVNTVTQTADETKNELANVSKTVDSQSAKINTISNTVDGTTQTISDIQTQQDKQSGSIATFQSRADAFDASITKINDFVNAQGQVNQLTNTEFTPDLEGWDSSETSSGVKTPYRQYIYQGSNMLTFDARNQTDKKYSAIKQTIPFATSGSNRVVSLSWWSRIAQGTGLYGSTHIRSYDANMTRLSDVSQVWNSSSSMTLQKFENVAIPDEAQFVEVTFAIREGYLAFLTKPMFVYQSTVGDYIQGNYNNNGALAKVKLTSDQAKLDLSNYKTDANGRISKAQADITATANEVKTKVSQSDYDAKTDDLTKKYGQVKTTADAVTTDVSKYKTANDKKVYANEASIHTLNNQITSRVSQTDFDKATGDLSGKYSETKQTVDTISKTVSELQAKANAQGQVNQLMNTEFNPDLEGWLTDSTDGSKVPYRSYARGGAGSITVGFNSTAARSGSTIRLIQTVILGSSTDRVVSLKWLVRTLQNNNYDNVRLLFRDSNNSDISDVYRSWADTSLDGTWHEIKWENITVPDNASTVNLYFQAREGTRAYLNKPMLVFANTIGDYVPGNYNNNARVTALELDVDGIHGLVDDPSKGLSATWNLASDGQSIAVQAKTAASTADGKAVAAQKDATTAITTANGTQTTVNHMQGDISDIQSTQTQTAGQVTAEIEDRKNGDKNTLTQANSFTSSQITSYDKGIQSQFTQQAKGIMASISTPNQLLNTEFNPDLEGWSCETTGSTKAPYRSYWNTYNQATTVALNTTTGDSTTYSRLAQNVQLASTTSTGNSISLSWSGRATQLDNYANLWANFYDASGNKISGVNTKWVATADGSWNDSKWENITVPDTATSVRISFEAREGTVAYLSHPMLVFGSTIGDTYMPGAYSGMNTSTVLELFKDNWALGITDNAGRLISGINGDASNTRIVGKQIILDNDTTVTGDFYAKGGNFQNLNASNFTGGTLNAAKVNVINIDASNISGGLIRGIDIEAADINMYNDNSKIHGDYDWTDQDEAIFPRRYVGNWNLGKRRLEFYGDVTPNDATNDGGKYSSYTYFGLDSIKMRRLFATGNLNRTLDINAGKGEIYIRKRDNEQQDMNANISVIEAGKAQLRGDNSDLIVSTNKILGDTNIRNTVELSSGNDNSDAFIQSYNVFGKRFNPPKGYEENVWMYFYPDSSDTYYGLGLLRGDKVSQGFLSSTWAYNNTYSYSSNMYITSNGNIGRATSASKYKLDITHYDDLDRANKLLSITPASWFDKSATEQYVDELNGGKESIEKIPVKPHYGLIAEDLVEAGLEEFVSYDTNTGEVEGLEYDRVWTVLIPLIKNMKQRIDQLEKGK